MTNPRARALQVRQALLALLVVSLVTSEAGAATQITGVQTVPAGPVARFEKLEITFQVTGSPATRLQWPYDPAPPAGIPAGQGITVNAVFTDPLGRQFLQPAFYAEQFLDEVRNNRDWHLPTGVFRWTVRFSPNRDGQWSFKLVVVDGNGTAESSSYAFSVTASTKRGFVRVARTIHGISSSTTARCSAVLASTCQTTLTVLTRKADRHTRR